MPYPTGADVVTLLTAAGHPAPAADDLNPYVVAASRQWEKATGWTPFLAKASFDAYDPPGATATTYGTGGGGTVLRLRKGLLVVNSITGPNGSSYILGQNVSRVESPEGWPTEALRFRMPIYGLPGSVVIDGVWGFCQDDPADPDLVVASRAIVQMAAGQYAEDSVQGRFTSAIVSVSEDDETVKIDQSLLLKAGSAWKTRGESAVEMYKRLTQWL